ncbi:MAG TPA: hypothetical protein VH253_19345 [Phycisphaerae bacterium]|nr:hypothetical protein [Phycisphaerae bacterium]
MRWQLLLATLVIGLSAIATGIHAADQDASPWSLQNQRNFNSLDELKSLCAAHHLRITVHQGTLSGKQYAVVLATPYSGVPTIDMYCYVQDGAALRLYSLTYLQNSAVKWDVEIHEQEDAIQVFHNGTLVAVLPLSDDSTTATRP